MPDRNSKMSEDLQIPIPNLLGKVQTLQFSTLVYFTYTKPKCLYATERVGNKEFLEAKVKERRKF